MTGVAHDVASLTPDKFKDWMGPTSGLAVIVLYSHNRLRSWETKPALHNRISE